MLNGDAHHSLSWEVELRIGRCRFVKRTRAIAGDADLVWIAAEHNRSRRDSEK
jgi:hypothetical protein